MQTLWKESALEVENSIKNGLMSGGSAATAAAIAAAAVASRSSVAGSNNGGRGDAATPTLNGIPEGYSLSLADEDDLSRHQTSHHHSHRHHSHLGSSASSAHHHHPQQHHLSALGHSHTTPHSAPSVAVSTSGAYSVGHPLYGRGACKWPGCESICEDYQAFLK